MCIGGREERQCQKERMEEGLRLWFYILGRGRDPGEERVDGKE